MPPAAAACFGVSLLQCLAIDVFECERCLSSLATDWTYMYSLDLEKRTPDKQTVTVGKRLRWHLSAAGITWRPASTVEYVLGSLRRSSPSDQKEKQSLLSGNGNGGARSPGKFGGFFGGTNGAAGGEAHEWEDDRGPEHFLCGIIPTKFRREFIAPLLCVLLMMGVAALVAGLLYRSLHKRERSQFSADLQGRCNQRTRLIQKNFGRDLLQRILPACDNRWANGARICFPFPLELSHEYCHACVPRCSSRWRVLTLQDGALYRPPWAA
jgi:hypothetical protein